MQQTKQEQRKNRDRLQHLKDAGWTVGDAKDFLGLTDEDMVIINQRIENRRMIAWIKRELDHD